MNIDLFMTRNGLFGLMTTEDFKEIPAGVLYDAETSEITIEFPKEDPFHCNINIDPSLSDGLIDCKKFYFGLIKNGQIDEAMRLPLLTLNDPYRDDVLKNMKAVDDTLRVVKEFGNFIKSSVFAQAVHRDDLSNEGDSRSILNGQKTAQLSFSPRMDRQKDMVVALGPQGPQAMPQATATVSAPEPGGPKGPGGIGGSRVRPVRRQQPPPKDDE
ncbi:MAG: hypothetical protein AAF988_07380 [Pseudomonadota bacterium]